MARLARAEIFDPNEVAILHICARVVRHCFLLEFDSISGKNFDHRKTWIEDQLKLLEANFGIDRLKLDVGNWKLLVSDFGRLLSSVAGAPKDVYEMRSLISKRRFYLKHPLPLRSAVTGP